MKNILTLLAFLFITAGAFAQNSPAITFTKSTHNFGEIKEGPKVSYDFEFKNTGKTPLILSGVEASCGCTTPDWPKEPIMPGQTSKIKVEYNTQGRPGQFNKMVTIRSNVGEDTRIFIEGNVIGDGSSAGHHHHNHDHNHNHEVRPAVPAAPVAPSRTATPAPTRANEKQSNKPY